MMPICPQQDGELVTRKVARPGDTDITYSVCLTCGGHWLRAFDANFLPLVAAREIENETPGGQPGPKNSQFSSTTGEQLLRHAQSKSEPVDFINNKSLHLTEDDADTTKLRLKQEEAVARQTTTLICPSCGFKLKRATGASIPDNVLAFSCPHGHGFYFPAGELSKFKVAQEAKIEYHRAWEIPLPSVAATLLTGLAGMILSAGLVLGVISGQREQTVVSRASEIISFERAYVSAPAKSVTFIVSTTAETVLTVHIKQTAFPVPLQTTDQKSHVARVTGLTSGSYDYYFTFEVGGKPLRSQDHSFVMP